MQRIIDVDVPVLLFDISNELVQGFHFLQVGHRADQYELLLGVGESCVKATDVLEVDSLSIVLDTGYNDQILRQ